MDYFFEWDAAKARRNLAKHGIAFEQTVGVFDDPLALSMLDAEHSEDGERWVTLGRARGEQLLVVVHTFEQHHDGDATVVRIISARRATSHEADAYQRRH